MDVLKELLPSERELVQVVVEVVIDLRDPTGDEVVCHFIYHQLYVLNSLKMDDLTHGTMPRERSLKRSISQLGLSQEQKAETDAVDIRCLDLCISMLRRVHSVWTFFTSPFFCSCFYRNLRRLRSSRVSSQTSSCLL